MNPSPKKTVRTRLAPSPTGSMHVGLARTGLFNWLFARQNKGEFWLRIEDTDRERSLTKYEDEIIEGLRWLGLDWDGPVYRQSERSGIYRSHLEKLIAEKKAYYCYCTKEELEAQKESLAAEGLPQKYGGHCRDLTEPPKGRKSQVIRFRAPEIEIEFKDLIRGRVKFDAALLGDMVVARDLNNPLYNFAAVVDDALMEITHVIRGEDHISNTPKQILIQQAFGFETPVYGHIPLILGSDRSKLSKRNAETSLLDYRNRGYLPEAMVNFLALLGWHPEGDGEIFTLAELVKTFDLGRVQKGGAIFNEEKLKWFNNQYLRRFSTDEILKLLRPEIEARKIGAPPEFLKKVVDLEKERLRTLGEFFEIAGFFFELPDYDRNLLKWKDQTLPDVQIALSKVVELWREVSKPDFNQKVLGEKLQSLVDGQSKGEVFWPVRAALSGRATSPDPLAIAEILGQEETIRRLEAAIQKIRE